MSTQRTVIRDGYVLTMDPVLGDFESADILIEDGEILAVGPHLGVTDANVIDARGHLVLPGFIDTHRHTWQSLVRGICGDWTLGDYYFGMRLGISPAYTADNVRLGNYYGAVDALNAGVTTLLDFSHCNNTPDHSDGAVQGLLDSGIRAAFCYGFFESSPHNSQFGDHSARIADFHRIAEKYFSSPGRVTLGVSLSEIFGLPWEQTVAELTAARERKALLVNHAGCVFGSPLSNGILEMDALGLLGPDMVHVHCTTFDDDAVWDALARSGGKVSISTQTEMNMGFGRPAFERCRQHGIKPTLSADIVSLNSGDLWHEMRLGLSCARADAADAINLSGHMPEHVAVTAREALNWPTVNAAEAMGMLDRVGSVTPGKRADLQIVGGPALEQHPVVDPYATLVFQTSSTDVRTVLVDGQVVKRDGVLTVADRQSLISEVDVASEEILGRIREAGRALPGTPPGAFAAIEPITREYHEQAVRAVLSGRA